MTRLIVSIENPSMLSDIRAAIRMIRGVVSVKTEKTGVSNPETAAAISEAEAGKGIRCHTFADYKKLVSDLDEMPRMSYNARLAADILH